MKDKLVIVLLPAILIFAYSCNQNTVGNVKLKTDLDSVSYLLGQTVGYSLSNSPMTEINSKAFLNGFMDGFDPEELFMDDQEAVAVITDYMRGLEDIEFMHNYDEGVAWLEENKNRDGVITTESGLQYEILVEGTGPKPTDTSTVTVHYHGTLIDGTVFESSVERGEPVEVNLGNLIYGWTEALQLMPVGSKWKLYIPTELAYGENPTPGGVIEPNMAIIFEVELISIND
jgi:FKBP-type peptidyl-prolyl cis-trans isomerase FklB